MVAHDLRSPLNQICAVLGLIKPSDQTFKDYLEIISNSSHRLRDMVGNILDVNAVDSSGIKVKIEKIDIEDVLSQIVRLYEPKAKKKDLSLEYNIHSRDPLEADKCYLEQAIENLLSNAIKFSPNGTSIRLAYRNDANGGHIVSIKMKALVSMRKNWPDYLLPIKNLVPNQRMGKIQQVWGLSIVKKYVEAFGGNITLRQ